MSVSFNCTDALSGVASGFPTGNTTLNTDTTGTLISGQCRDQAGNTASLAIGPMRIDTTRPVPQFISASPVNPSGWSNGPVTVTWACSDGGSGPQTPTVTHTVSASGTDSVTCTDVAGNTGTATSPQIRIDTIAPSINLMSPLNNFTYPQNSSVFASYLCSDSGGSGVPGDGCVGAVPHGRASEHDNARRFHLHGHRDGSGGQSDDGEPELPCQVRQASWPGFAAQTQGPTVETSGT